jgi:hypothetical protein
VPTKVSMNPGDALVFHGDQLHASVLNRTSRTRYVVSFRLTLERPHFANGHYHRSVFAPLSVGLLERGPLSWLPEAPAKFALSYFRARAGQLRALSGQGWKPGVRGFRSERRRGLRCSCRRGRRAPPRREHRTRRQISLR